MRALVRIGAARRLSRGLFFIVPFKTPDPDAEHPRDEAAVAAALFRPCYIGGWTAAAEWNLYFSMRPETFVVTSRRVRATSVRIGEIPFHLVYLPERLITGPGVVTRRGGTCAVSDPERTLVDALRSPSWLGGARALARALEEHYRSDRWDMDCFIEALAHAGNGAAIKRLGALALQLRLGMAEVLYSVADRRTRGIVALEPGAGSGGRIDWRLRVRLNVDVDGEEDVGDDLEEGDLEGLDDG